jgi:hypothetical protein
MKTVNFLGYECIVEKHAYKSNDRVALELYIEATREPMATATTNLPGIHLEKDEVIIKNYSENEGLYEILVEAGIISKAIRIEPTGWVEVLVCKLLI